MKFLKEIMNYRKYLAIIRDRLISFKRSIAKYQNKVEKKNIIIIASATVFFLLAAAAGYYFYFYNYLQTNFEDVIYNNVDTSSMEKIEPGETVVYEIKYKNTGYWHVDKLNIVIPIPENTRLTAFTEGGELDEGGTILIYTISDVGRDKSGKIIFDLEIANPLDSGTRIKVGDIRLEYFIGEESFGGILDSGEGHIVSSSPDLSSFSAVFLDVNRAPLSPKTDSPSSMVDLASAIMSFGGILDSGEGHIVSSSPDLSSFSAVFLEVNKVFLFLGDEIKYVFRVKNTGNMIAREIEIISEISAFLVPVEDSISLSGRYDGEKIIWEVDGLFPGETRSFWFHAILEEGEAKDREEIITSAYIIYSGEEIVSKELKGIARLFPDFFESTIALSDANGGGYLWAGETINVKVTIKNTGQTEAEEYQLYCPIPGPAAYVSQSGTPEGIRWDDGISGLVWDLKSLDVGESREITFDMTVDSGYYYKSGTIKNESYIIAGEEKFTIEPASINVKGHPYLNVVVMGDSLIVKSDWVQRLDNKLEAAFPVADYNTAASAFNGEMSFEGLARYDDSVGPLRPSILIVAYGTNDIGASQSYFRYSIDTIITKAKGSGATVFINLIGPVSTPGKSEWPIYNDIIIQVAAKHGIPVINVTSVLSQNKGKYLYDGVHYSPEGAEVVAQTVFDHIVPYLNGLGGRR